MIISRVFPCLIKSNQVIRLSFLSKAQLLNSVGLSRLKHFPELQKNLLVKKMSIDIEKELNDPKRHLDYNQLVETKNKGDAVIIDVREHSEIKETGKIPGSIHIPLAEVGNALGEMQPEEFKKQYNAEKPQKNAEVIFSCKAGGRSFKALKLGLELGYNNARNYKGGWLDWAEKTSKS